MFNLQIHFNYPYLFLLLIPAIALALIPYFRLSKRYRKNRNRITSIVLHIVVMFLAITVLVGVDFTYEVYNPENEIMLVVDATFSTSEEKEAKDDYVSSVISMTNSKAYKLGIVTFGYDQCYAVPLTNNLSGAYNRYLESPLPDTTATDIAAALSFAKDKFENPETAKIVLVSDGIETDETALSVVRSIASTGIRVDTVNCATLEPDQEVQIVGAEMPDNNVALYETFNINLTLRSKLSDATDVELTLFDNGEAVSDGFPITLTLGGGNSSYLLEYSLAEYGLHSLNFVISSPSDEVSYNNSFYSYIYIIEHKSILIVQAYDGESDALSALLSENYEPVVMNVSDEDFPATLDDLRTYDEIILNNIANSDLPEGFVNLLYEYVYEIGGGLFTVGGSDPEQSTAEEIIAHAYDRQDMSGSILQQMLPVQAIDYTPPLGLAIIIDVSGSMGTRLDAAKDTARSVVQDSGCLTERDYCGVLTLSTDFDEKTPFYPMTRQDDLLEAIDKLESSGSTNFAPALRRASMNLLTLYGGGTIQKMHVIVFTDAGAGDKSEYPSVIEQYTALGVSFSFVAIEVSDTDQNMIDLRKVAAEYGCKVYNTTIKDLTNQVKIDIGAPEIKSVEYGEFIPTLDKNSSYGKIISQDEMPKLYGFYGTKVKSAAELVLYGDYGVPIYAQWSFGAGMVGSFMCDLKSTDWSSEFMSADAGKKFINAIVNKLFPEGEISPSVLNVVLREENYITQVSIYPSRTLESGESIKVEVTLAGGGTADVSVIQPTASNSYSRATLVIKEPGVYIITVKLYNGSELENERTVYKTFSYSAEYNMFNETDGEAMMKTLAETDGGGVASILDSADPYTVFQGFVTSIKKNFDPRFILIIIALILFLLDIAVRKFKFKWPHEIIRNFIEKRKGK